MLYNWTGKAIEETKAAKAPQFVGERLVRWESIDRAQEDQSRALTPTRLDAMFRQANSGDPQAQAALALEIEEKDWDVSHSLSTRRSAVQGLTRKVTPAIEDDSQAEDIAGAAEEMLNAISVNSNTDVPMDGAIDAILSAILPGYACLEIMWQPGGVGIDSFSPVMTSAISFLESMEPLIVTRNQPNGVGLAPNKFIFHRHRSRSGDATRGGLIRPLGWMYLFANLGVKDVLRYVEKFGMPFVSARIDDTAWEKDRSKIAYLIRNFGSDGGAVFSKAVELELMQAAGTDGAVYFRLLEYFGQAKTKVILGQTATSGDAGGFSKGQAQSLVRQDILEADCRAVEESIRRCVLTPWVEWNFGPEAPVPYFHIESDPPEDMQSKATVVKTLSDAGYPANPDWVEKTFGIPILRGAEAQAMRPQAQAFGGLGAVAMAGESDGVKKKPLKDPRRLTRW